MIRGMVAGKFMPLHEGHLALLKTALSECDHLDIISSHSTAMIERCSSEIGYRFDPEVIRRWLTLAVNLMAAQSRVSIHVLDETEFPEYPAGVPVWGDAVLKLIGEQPDKIFTGDPCYQETYKVKFPNSEVIVIPRSNSGISATMIRNDFLTHKHQVPPWVRFDILASKRENILKSIEDMRLTLDRIQDDLDRDCAISYLCYDLEHLLTESRKLGSGIREYA